MSAQGLNSTTYNGFYFGGTGNTGPGKPGVGIPLGFPTRDASDYTRRLKQLSIARQYNGSSVMTGSANPYNNSFIVPVDYTIVQSNENRISYHFGMIGCTGCSGPFPDLPLGATR